MALPSTLEPKRVTDFIKFVELVPKAVEAFDESYTRWAREMTNQQLISELVAEFRPENEFYADVNEQGEIVYFFAIQRTTEAKAHFWIIYVHPKARSLTRPMVTWVLNRYKDKGFETLDFTTTRLTRSYKRWAEKFKATPYALTYRINLKDECFK